MPTNADDDACQIDSELEQCDAAAGNVVLDSSGTLGQKIP